MSFERFCMPKHVSITIADLKKALHDRTFVESLPEVLKEGHERYMKAPGCNCHLPFFKRVLEDARKELKEYFAANGINLHPKVD